MRVCGALSGLVARFSWENLDGPESGSELLVGVRQGRSNGGDHLAEPEPAARGWRP